ncbi:hypothetical protein O181_065580 [Austropuccinia psidii MF-1]|uniref:Uncharacterized protein n=1 Tax=Austropuccinia psidii MF-1 TaxID=1389203 RepID=A0A9Q3I485_9BASI|nr:hypothetical protein [Austropuccinia psidii MF-1]
MESYIPPKNFLYKEDKISFHEENYHQDYYYEEEEGKMNEDLNEEMFKKALESVSKIFHLIPKQYPKGVTEIIQEEEVEGREDQMKLIFIKIKTISNYIQEKKEKERTMKKL